MPRYWLDRMTHVTQTAVLVNKAEFEWSLMKRQEGVCWQLASLRDDPAWVSCHYLTAKSVCVEARSWSSVCVCVSGGRGETDRQADSQTEEGFVCWLAILVFTPLSYLPFSLQSLYVAMSLPLIDGLLVLPLVRKLAFVCLSVKELKEDALLTDVYEGTSSVCVCACARVCVTLLVSISSSSWSLKQYEFYLVTMVTGANRRAGWGRCEDASLPDFY